MGNLYKCVVWGLIGIWVRLGTPSYRLGRKRPCQCRDVSSSRLLCTYISAVSPSVNVNVCMGFVPFTAIARASSSNVTIVSAMYKSYRTVFCAKIVVKAIRRSDKTKVVFFIKNNSLDVTIILIPLLLKGLG